MSRNENPPFARGQTFWQGDTTAISTTDYNHLVGREFVFEDTVNGTGQWVRCRVLRAGARITKGRFVVGYTITSGSQTVGRTASGLATASGTAVVSVLDDAYALATADGALQTAGSPDTLQTAIETNDLFYVVVEGPCKVSTEATAGGAAGAVVALGGVAGLISDKTLTGKYVIGRLDATATNSVNNVLVWVDGIQSGFLSA